MQDKEQYFKAIISCIRQAGTVNPNYKTGLFIASRVSRSVFYEAHARTNRQRHDLRHVEAKDRSCGARSSCSLENAQEQQGAREEQSTKVFFDTVLSQQRVDYNDEGLFCGLFVGSH